MPKELALCAVNDHDEALEAIHRAIRCKTLPFANLAMVHFDAHPDLSVPRSLPAASAYDPEALYQHLRNTDGGISEWILPLAFTGHLSTCWWVRPPWTEEIPDGRHEFFVGAVVPTPEELEEEDAASSFGVQACAGPVPAGSASSGGPPSSARVPPGLNLRGRRLRVSSALRYYADDYWCVAPRGRMDPAAPLSVLVGTVEPAPPPQRSRTSAAEAWAAATDRYAAAARGCSGWVLDICLDFFGTFNPFAYRLERLLGAPTLSAALRAAAAEPLACHQGSDSGSGSNADDAGQRPDARLAAQLRAARGLERGLSAILVEPALYARLLAPALTAAEEPGAGHGPSGAAPGAHPRVEPEGDCAPRADGGGGGGEGGWDEGEAAALLASLLGLFASRRRAVLRLADLAAEAGAASAAAVAGALAMVPCARLPHNPSTQAEAMRGVEVSAVLCEKRGPPFVAKGGHVCSMS